MPIPLGPDGGPSRYPGSPASGGGPAAGSGPGAGGGGAAAGGSPIPGSPIPGAANYAQAEVLANNAYQKALAQLNKNRLNTLLQYGYTGKVDPHTGTINGVTVDTHSMFGQLQQMLHGQALEDQSASFDSADRGLLGGLAHQGLSQLHYQHGAEDTAMGQSLQSALSDYQGQQQDATEARDSALWQAEQDAAGSATSDQLGADITALITALGNGKGADSSSSGGGSGGSGGGSGKGGGSHRSKAVGKILSRKRHYTGGGTAVAN